MTNRAERRCARVVRESACVLPPPHLGKLVLLSERDPKAFEVPLVGLWVSGVDELLEAYAWAACARYASLPPSTASTVTVRGLRLGWNEGSEGRS